MRIEWPTLFIIILCYSLWVIAGLFLYPHQPLAALLVMAVLTAWQSSLTHEAVHGHPTSISEVNEALVFFPLMIVFPFRRYKASHIAHHNDERLTDPFDDPESYYLSQNQYHELALMLRYLLRLNNSLVGRLTIGPVLTVVGFLNSEVKAIATRDKAILLAWFLHCLGAGVVLSGLYILGVSFADYLLFVVWPSLSLILLRSYAEHQWHESPDGRSIIIDRSWLSLLYLNNNLHLVHHKNPGAAWYELPRLYAEKSADWKRLNKGYVYSGYWRLWKQWAFRTKEKLVHPRYGHE